MEDQAPRKNLDQKINPLNSVRIILVETSHPGNVGAVARAMKTMGLTNLILVNPKDPKVNFNPEAIAMASNAIDVLEAAQIVASLELAIADCHYILGTSARRRYLDWPLMTPREASAQVVNYVESKMQVAILFGRERNGLENYELERCHAHVYIPANPEYSSLNLAQAVQLVAYEMRLALLSEAEFAYTPKDPLALPGQLEGFYTAVEEVLLKIKFLDPKAPRKLMPRLKRLFQRFCLEEVEVKMLRGIFEELKKRV